MLRYCTIVSICGKSARAKSVMFQPQDSGVEALSARLARGGDRLTSQTPQGRAHPNVTRSIDMDRLQGAPGSGSFPQSSHSARSTAGSNWINLDTTKRILDSATAFLGR